MHVYVAVGVHYTLYFKTEKYAAALELPNLNYVHGVTLELKPKDK